jgi:hypothetical protein
MALPNSVTSEHPIGGGASPSYMGGPGGQVGFYQDPYGASFLATISGTTMTVLSLSAGSIVIGQTITSGATAAVITAMGTATAQTGAGAIGTWTISVSQTVSTPTLMTSGLGAVAQPAGNLQTAVVRGQQAGVITTYASNTLSPSAVAQITVAAQTLTPLTGTGAQMNLATGDILYVNKPTSQAGLGVGNTFVNGAGTISMNFSNIPAGGNITPTASQSYTIVALRGLGQYNLAPVLSPAAVPANSSVEQQFAVVGLPVGALVQVIKPTQQAGLDIGGCRVVSNNILGITFINPTAAAITPTASETYAVVALPGLDTLNNDVLYGFNVGAVGAITAGVVISGGSTTLTGMLATDVITGIFKPTPQAAATNVATPIYGVPTANTLTMYFLGTGTGGTPTSSEIYGIRTARLNPVAPLVVFSQTLTPVSVAALTTAEQTFAITTPNTLVSGAAVWVNKPSWTNGLAIAGVRISAANTLAINYANLTTSAIVPPAEAYTIGSFQVVSPGAGNSVYQTVSPAFQNVANMTSAMRSALVSTNFIAGA